MWPEFGSNVVVHWEYGDKADVEGKLAAAAHRVSVDLVNNRLAVSPMEPRVAAAVWDAKRGIPHRLHAEPGRAAPAGRAGGEPAEAARRQGARHLQGHGRRLRHPLEDVSRDRDGRPRCDEAEPAGEMARRPLGDVRLRLSRPRPGQPRGNGPRQGRQDHRPEGRDARQRRRVPVGERRAPAHGRRRPHHPLRVPRAGLLLLREAGLHQHDLHRHLSRRRAARGELHHGAPDGRRGREDGPAARRSAPAQFHPAGPDALQDAPGLHHRFRRFRRHDGHGAGCGRLEGLRGAPQGGRRARPASAGSASPSSSRARARVRWKACG